VLSLGSLDLKGYWRPSGVGVSKVMVVLAPGAIGAMVELAGKQASGEHPAGRFE
jgi:hypothetical protein